MGSGSAGAKKQELEPSNTVFTSRIAGGKMNKVRPTENATQFKAELWTVCGETSREVWAAVMLDGPDKGQPCAFGPKGEMENYAQHLNENKGEL